MKLEPIVIHVTAGKLDEERIARRVAKFIREARTDRPTVKEIELENEHLRGLLEEVVSTLMTEDGDQAYALAEADIGDVIYGFFTDKPEAPYTLRKPFEDDLWQELIDVVS